MKKILSIGAVILAGWLLQPGVVSAACSGNNIRVIVRDAEGNLLPSLNYRVHNRLTNPDGDYYFGTSTLASGKTDAGGQGPMHCLPAAAAPYAIKLYDRNATYGYSAVWDVAELGEELSDIDVTMPGMFVVIRDADTELLKNVRFDVFQQSYDVDDRPIVDETKLNVDKLVASNYTTGDAGGVNVYLGAGSYVLRIHGTGTTHFHIWDQHVSDGERLDIEYHLSTLRVVLEDGFGGLVKSQKFSIYKQKYDVRNQPILGEPVVENATTGEAGTYDAYLPNGQYALRVAATGRSAPYIKWKVRTRPQELTAVTYRLSGARIMLRDPKGELARNAKFVIARQRFDAFGKPIVDSTVASNLSTGEAGYADVYLPQGSYVLIYGQKRLYQLDVFDGQFTKVDYPNSITYRPHREFAIVSPLSNTNILVRRINVPRIRGLRNFDVALTKAYRVNAERFVRPYTATFTYTETMLDDAGIGAGDVRVAFYDQLTKRWRYVGRNYPSRKQVVTTATRPGVYVLVSRY